MGPHLLDRVRETTTTTGTGTITLAGAVAGFQSFAAVGDGNTCFYSIVDPIGGGWEVGIGTFTLSGTTLSRDSVLASSNSGSPVNFPAGTKDVFVTAPGSILETIYNRNTGIIQAFIGDGVNVITTGEKFEIGPLPFAITITEVSLSANETGDIVIDLWKDLFTNPPPDVADSVTASAKPTLSSARRSRDSTLTGWTTAWAADDTIIGNVDSASAVKRVSIALKWVRP